jgi:CheY-specific phosphatase CheX
MSETPLTDVASTDDVFLPLLNASFHSVLTAEQPFSSFNIVPAISSTRDICATISLTGPVSIMLLLVLDHAVAWRLMQHEVKPLGLDENDEMLEAVLGELINIIGGNATAKLSVDGQHIHLSLPMVLQAAKLKPAGRVCIQQSHVSTHYGEMDAFCVSPANLSFS